MSGWGDAEELGEEEKHGKTYIIKKLEKKKWTLNRPITKWISDQ